MIVVPKSDTRFVRKARKIDPLTRLWEVEDAADLGVWSQSISDRGRILSLICTHAARNRPSFDDISAFSDNLLSLRRFESMSGYVASLVS